MAGVLYCYILKCTCIVVAKQHVEHCVIFKGAHILWLPSNTFVDMLFVNVHMRCDYKAKVWLMFYFSKFAFSIFRPRKALAILGVNMHFY